MAAMAKTPATTPLAAGMATAPAALPAADDDDDAALFVPDGESGDDGVEVDDESSDDDDDDVDLELEADVEEVGFCASQALQYDTFWFCTPLASVVFFSSTRQSACTCSWESGKGQQRAYQSWGRRCSIAKGWWPPGRTIVVVLLHSVTCVLGVSGVGGNQRIPSRFLCRR